MFNSVFIYVSGFVMILLPANNQIMSSSPPVYLTDFNTQHCDKENPSCEDVSANTTSLANETRIIVELAIICDKDFGDLFNHSFTKILNYWKIFLWDVNNRLKTITTANISIHITQLIVMSSYSEQPFIENSRDNVSKTVNLGKLLQEFATWTYNAGHTKNLTGFDIAMGVTGVPFSGKQSGWGYHNGTCDISARHRKNFGVLVLSDMGDFRTGTVSHELGHLLGARHDYEFIEKDCRNYIMDYSNWRGNKRQFNFSECASQAIGKFLAKSSCLKRKDFHGKILYNADEERIAPPTIKQQCERVVQSTSGFAWNVNDKIEWCQRVRCTLQRGNETKTWKYTPVDNSPCKESGVCFRGTCKNTN